MIGKTVRKMFYKIATIPKAVPVLHNENHINVAIRPKMGLQLL
jgi:hypothetical protein